MNLFGIGGLELVAILIVALLIAGPRRMVRWAYLLGQGMAKLKAMWTTLAASLQSELDAQGVDVKVPAKLPTRAALDREMQRILKTTAASPAPPPPAEVAAPVVEP